MNHIKTAFLISGFVLLVIEQPIPLVHTASQPLITERVVLGKAVVSSLQNSRMMKPKEVNSYSKLPLAFETNQGQTDPRVKFIGRCQDYMLFLTADEAVLDLSKPSPERNTEHSVLRMGLVGANLDSEVLGQDELPGKSNYFLGNDTEKWYTSVPQFSKVRYANVYPDIDLVYYSKQRHLEFDFVLRPGAHLDQLRLRITGEKRMRLEHDGNLVLSTENGDVYFRRPIIHQEIDGNSRTVEGSYIIRRKNEIGFRVSSYSRTATLIIDPVLAYSTYLGGTGGNQNASAAVDALGNVFVTGQTASSAFPVVNAFQGTYQGNGDAFVSKLNADGTALIYSTYFGGSGNEYGRHLTVDQSGNAYIVGYTDSKDFPTLNPVQPTNGGGQDAFISKLNPAGDALVYSTYLGGSGNDVATDIAVDSNGNAYVTGLADSTDFPAVNAIQSYGGNGDAFISKLNASGSALVYSTFVGGTAFEEGTGISVDSNGNAIIAGVTYSTDFPVLSALQGSNHGLSDAFVSKLNTSGTALVFSIYLGGSNYDQANGIALDDAGNAYVTGTTQSVDFPIKNAIQSSYGGGAGDAFLSKVGAMDGSLVYSTYLGGNAYDFASAVTTDSGGNVIVAGYTASLNFPLFNAIQNSGQGGYDNFVSKVNNAGTAFLFSTYFGGRNDDIGLGVAVDQTGSVYLVGFTKSSNFPITRLAFQPRLKGGTDGFIAKIAPQTFVSLSPLKVSFPLQVVGSSRQKNITFTNTGSNALTFNQMYMTGTNANDFANTSNCPNPLASGGVCTVTITFTPLAKNTRQATLAISDSDPASPQSIPLSGVGTVVSLSATKLAFGKQTVGTSVSKNAALTNVGGVQLDFTGFSITGSAANDYSQMNTCGTSIAAGANCTITVTFKPSTTGMRNAVLNISDDGGGSPQKISLSGTGT